MDDEKERKAIELDRQLFRRQVAKEVLVSFTDRCLHTDEALRMAAERAVRVADFLLAALAK